MRIITLNENNKIIGIKNVGDRYIVQENEISTLKGTFGQIVQEDGTFVDAPVEEETEQQVTLEDKINYLYYKSMGVI